jgi:hypothetical protein
VIGQRSLCNQDHPSRAVELVGPGRQRSLIANDRRRADEMYRGREVARKLETWDCQLQIGIRKFNDGIEQRRR